MNLFIVITLFCWGIWGILDKKALQKASPYEVLFRLYALALIEIPIVVWMLNVQSSNWNFAQIDNAVWFYTAIAALLQCIAIVCYLEAMSMTEASYVLGITASYPLVLQILAVFYLGETFVLNRFIGAILIGIGVAAIGSSVQKSQKLDNQKQKFLLLLYVILATVSWGVWGLFDKKALMLASPLEVFLAERSWEAISLIGVLVICKLKSVHIDIRSSRTWLFSGLSGLTLAVGRYTFLSALALASASYVIAITGCYPLLMYIFAILFLKEKLNYVRLCGIALVIVGGVLVQVTQTM